MSSLDGTWRNVGGILRWSPQPTPNEVADLRARMRPPTHTQIDVHHLIACPTCGARVDQRCHTTGGNSTANHAARLVSVRCPCGERVGLRKRYCEHCRQRARKQTYRLREIRQPTVERRAS